MKEHIQLSPVFGSISEAGVELLASSGSWVALTAGEILFSIGDEADSFYLIVEGRLNVLVAGVAGAASQTGPAMENILAVLGPGDVAGEVQILTGGTRSATLRAVTRARLISFPRSVFERMAVTEKGYLDHVRNLVLHQLRRTQLASILPPLFGDLEPRQMEEIESLGRWVSLEKGKVLFRQGDAGDGACFLVSGLLSVLIRKGDGSFQVVNHIRHGEVVGEMALLSDDTRSATVRAARDSSLLFFGKREFTTLLEKHPRFMLGIARTNISRLRHSMSVARPVNVTSVAAIIQTSADVPIAAFTQHLAKSLAGNCSVLHVDRKRLQSVLGAPDDSATALEILVNARFPAWLCSVEGKHRLILLETDWNDPLWTERCVRQADQVLTVGLAAGSPALSDIEARYVFPPEHAGEVRKRLVLIHPDTCERPQGTASWLRDRHVEMHHHLRMGSARDFGRLARFLTDSAICVALGGGGARGFAHIGAFRALCEEGAPVDIVGGTSMGAVIGAEHALGMSAEQMLRANKSLFSNKGLMLDLTLPLLSFTTGKAYAGTLKHMFGQVEIEDLWIPFFCVTSNISRAERAIHRAGLLWRKVRASSGVQGMFPPVVIQGELHVDGAPFSNLPADAMKTVCDGTVIAIDVSPPVDLVSHTDYGDVISGWKILWKRYLPGREKFRCTDIGTIMQRAGEAVSMANQKLTIERMSDYYLKMPVDEIGMFAFSALPRLERIGYEYTKQKIAEWRAAGKWISFGVD